jgi:hypothetical protein
MIFNLRLKIMCLGVSYKKKYEEKKNSFLRPSSHWRKEPDPELDVDPQVRGADPDPHQNVTDPQTLPTSFFSINYFSTWYWHELGMDSQLWVRTSIIAGKCGTGSDTYQ